MLGSVGTIAILQIAFLKHETKMLIVCNFLVIIMPYTRSSDEAFTEFFGKLSLLVAISLKFVLFLLISCRILTYAVSICLRSVGGKSREARCLK